MGKAGEHWRTHIFISREPWQLGAPPFCPVCEGVLSTEGLDDWTQTKGRSEGSFARRPVCSVILMISAVTIYSASIHLSLAALGQRPNHSADADSLSRHLGSSDIDMAPAFCENRGCLKTQQEGRQEVGVGVQLLPVCQFCGCGCNQSGFIIATWRQDKTTTVIACLMWRSVPLHHQWPWRR